MFWIKNKKIMYTPENPSFFYIKVGFKGVFIARTCFPDRHYQVVYVSKMLLPLPKYLHVRSGVVLTVSESVSKYESRTGK